MSTYAKIKCDTNDADYISEFIPLSQEDKVLLEKLAEILKTKETRRWGTNDCAERYNPHELYSEYFSEEEIDLISELLPYNEYGVHSIDSIEFFDVNSTRKIL